MTDNDAHRVGPVWTPGPRLAGFIKRTTIYCYTQNMKALGLVVSEKIFYVFPMTPPGRARMDPRGTVGRIYKEDHYTLLHTKYESSGALWFQRRRFLFCFSIVSLWELSVAMETRVLIRPSPKPNITFPPPQ